MSGSINSNNSWIKHQMARRAAASQVHAARASFPAAKMLFTDGNAGDAIGVQMIQGGLFGDELSETTPELLVRLAKEVGNTDVILCEKMLKRRMMLQRRFPDARLLKDHSSVPFYLGLQYDYAIWISDPCGYSKHGVDAMAEVAKRIPRSDFVIAFNEKAMIQLLGCKRDDPYWGRTRGDYHPMIDPQWWMEKLNKRFLARNRNVIDQSPRFGLRLMVVSNFIADHGSRLEIIHRNNKGRWAS